MAYILILDDDQKIQLLLEHVVTGLGHKATTSGCLREGLRLARTQDYDLILLDLDFPEGNGLEILPELLHLSSSPEVMIITGTGDTKGAELAFTYGAWDFLKKPFFVEEVSLSIARALQYHEEKVRSKTPTVLQRGDITGNSPALLRCLDDAARAAATDSSVLILGETGTGKELFAKAIHENSWRAKKNFIVIDCGALPETLVESILFGHRKGAFTGAGTDREGLIAQADGGTLFLDEIGELPLPIQKTLLRTLQEHRLRPIGASEEISVDFRLVAATNCDLEKMVADQTFREDLLFRIRGIEFKLPPLRERKDDILTIAHHKILQLSKLYGLATKGISVEFSDILEQYEWPGNVRELINVLEHALANAGADPTLVPKHLPAKYRATFLDLDQTDNLSNQPPHGLRTFTADGEILKWGDFRLQMETVYLQSLLINAEGNWETACKLSGLSKTRLYELMKKHQLSFSST